MLKKTSSSALTILNVPFYIQSLTSANCAPCSVKMLLDYYFPKNEGPFNYSIHSLNRILKASHEFGVEESEIWNFFKDQQLGPQKIATQNISQRLGNGHPLLVLFQDEVHDGHFAVIIGERRTPEGDFYIFHDPWPEFGPYFEREKEWTHQRCQVFNNWIITLDIKNS